MRGPRNTHVKTQLFFKNIGYLATYFGINNLQNKKLAIYPEKLTTSSRQTDYEPIILPTSYS